jgi:hypothetical protein
MSAGVGAVAVAKANRANTSSDQGFTCSVASRARSLEEAPAITL